MTKFWYAKNIIGYAFIECDPICKVELMDALHFAIVGDYDRVDLRTRRRWDKRIIFTKFTEDGESHTVFSYGEYEEDD